jgi:hypothetical protein
MGKLVQLHLPEGSTPLALIAAAFLVCGVVMRQASLVLQKKGERKGKRLKRLGSSTGGALLETLWATMVGAGAGVLAGDLLSQLPRTAVLG